MWECKKCGEYKFNDPQICNCKEFLVVDEEGEEHNVWAMDEQDAALKYAEESNPCNDYYLMNETVDILVNGKAFRIGAEPDVHYFASTI